VLTRVLQEALRQIAFRMVQRLQPTQRSMLALPALLQPSRVGFPRTQMLELVQLFERIRCTLRPQEKQLLAQ
jgi:hypothetical protein